MDIVRLIQAAERLQRTKTRVDQAPIVGRYPSAAAGCTRRSSTGGDSRRAENLSAVWLSLTVSRLATQSVVCHSLSNVSRCWRESTPCDLACQTGGPLRVFRIASPATRARRSRPAAGYAHPLGRQRRTAAVTAWAHDPPSDRLVGKPGFRPFTEWQVCSSPRLLRSPDLRFDRAALELVRF